MKVYTVVLMLPALEDLQRRADKLVVFTESIEAVAAWQQRIGIAIEGLRTFPTGHATDPSMTEEFGVPIRRLIFERQYRVFFRVKEDISVVEVVAIQHGARTGRNR